MTQLLRNFDETLAYLLLALPIGVLAWLILAYRRHGRGTAWREAAIGAALDLLAVGSVVGALFVTLQPLDGTPARLYLTPFSDIGPILTGGGYWGTILSQIGGNVLLFMPLGFFLPLWFRALDGLARIVLFAAALSVSVEAAQYLLPLGRSVVTDDVLLNVAGAAIGFLLMRALVSLPTVASLLRCGRQQPAS